MWAVTAVIEVTDLEGLLAEPPPPCEMTLMQYMAGGECLCGKPSDYRVRAVCPCGAVRVRFLCKKHLADLKKGKVGCYTCLKTDFALRLT